MKNNLDVTVTVHAPNVVRVSKLTDAVVAVLGDTPDNSLLSRVDLIMYDTEPTLKFVMDLIAGFDEHIVGFRDEIMDRLVDQCVDEHEAQA